MILKNDRKIIIPDLFKKFISDSSSFKICTDKEIQNLNKISKDIKKGKFIIVEKAKLSNISNLYDFVNKKIDEFIPHELKNNLKLKNNTRSKKFIYDNKKKQILDQILILAKNDNITTFDDKKIPNLIYFCGSDFKYSDEEFVLPFRFYNQLTEKLNESVFVKAADKEFRTGINVLLPKSQETYLLFKSSIENLKLKNNLDVLDMGCGSGVISAIMNNYIDNSRIYFTDILPEAIASALLNLRSISDSSNKFTAMHPGSLYDNIDIKFDIITFNPPWIDSKASNRSELALNDKGQKTLKEFLFTSKKHLKDDGKILLAFSDNSGEKAVEIFEKNIADNHYKITDIYTDKIQSYQSGRKWMKIFVYELKIRF